MLAHAAEAVDRPVWKIALAEEAFRRWLASSPLERSEDLDIAAALAERWLGAQMDVGLAARTAATFKSLPAPVRDRLTTGITASVRTTIGGLPFQGKIRDWKLDLAAAFLLAGDPKAAGEWVRRVPEEASNPSAEWWRPPGEIDLEGEERYRDSPLFRQLLARTLMPSSADPFDLLIQATQVGQSLWQSWFGQPWSLGRKLVIARLAELESYPAVAAYIYEPAGDALENGYEPVPDRGVHPRLLAAVQDLERELAELQRSFKDRAAASRETARAGLGPDPAAALIPRLLRTPGRVRFAEKPLPKGIAPRELTPQQEEELSEEAKAMSLPDGFSAVRIERNGQRSAAIGVSQSYDPVGESSPGAYWILLSEDGGATWERPLYTGLRINLPYVVRQASALPLFEGDRLRIEVEIRELDTTVITFPPIALDTKRTAKGLFLEIPIAELRRDTDRDGLTDLAEERLLTDPESPDTDGDGFTDAADPLPGVPWQSDRSPAAQALTAFLTRISGVEQAAIIEGLPGPKVLCCPGDRPALASERTDFYTGDRALFAGLDPSRRLVVLTKEEARDAREKFGPFFPKSISVFLIDRAGRRAYVIWSAGWQGGEVALEEKDGEWTAYGTSFWIT